MESAPLCKGWFAIREEGDESENRKTSQNSLAPSLTPTLMVRTSFNLGTVRLHISLNFSELFLLLT